MKNSDIEKRKYYSGAQKNDPCAKKNEPRNKKPSVKNFIFFVDKLNMIDFNIFKMLKLIFTCESCAFSMTEKLRECKVSTQLYIFCLSSTLIVSLKTC